MPNLQQYREKFIAQVRRYVPHDGERLRFTEVLDHFIDWSDRRPTELSHYDGEYDQHVVSFKRPAGGPVFWSAYPRSTDGAKFEILPGSHAGLSPKRLEDALTVIRSISREVVSEETTLRIPFLALKSKTRRDCLTALMERILADSAAPVTVARRTP